MLVPLCLHPYFDPETIASINRWWDHNRNLVKGLVQLAFVLLFSIVGGLILCRFENTAERDASESKDVEDRVSTWVARRTKAAAKAAEGTLDAATCWREQFGRFKYCGLRANPCDENSGPPRFTAQPLDLLLPAMSARESTDLAELRDRLGDLSDKHRTDPSTLVRYMRARKWDIEKTETFFREAAAWRDAHGVHEALTIWNLDAYEKCFAPWLLSGGLLGHGKRGEPIAYERLATCHWPKLLKMLPFELFEKLDIVHCIRSLAAIEEDSMRRNRPVGDAILVVDMAGFSWDQCSVHAARSLSRLFANRENIMPETVARFLVIRAPAALVCLWNTIKHFLDPRIASKVRICGCDPEVCLSTLREFIADDEIPAFLGGCNAIDGDPQCRKVLAPGGLVPQEAVKRFAELTKPSSGGSRGPSTAMRTPCGCFHGILSAAARLRLLLSRDSRLQRQRNEL